MSKDKWDGWRLRATTGRNLLRTQFLWVMEGIEFMGFYCITQQEMFYNPMVKDPDRAAEFMASDEGRLALAKFLLTHQ